MGNSMNESSRTITIDGSTNETLAQESTRVSPVENNTIDATVEIESEKSENNDSESNIEESTCGCSICNVQLTSLLSTSVLFTVHEHSYISIPACGRCSERALEVEKSMIMRADEQEFNEGENENETNYCSLCARDDEEVEEFFLCDNCPRSICRECMVLVYTRSSGDSEIEAAEQVISELSHSNCDWYCFRCISDVGGASEPSKVHEWRSSLKRIMNYHPLALNEIEDEEYEVNILIEKLTMLEDAKVEASQSLEDKDIEMKRVSILNELQGNCEVQSNIEAAVEEELLIYITQWKNHFECIEVDIPLIQEHLEKNGISIENFYAERNKARPQFLSKDEVKEEDTARKSAEEALNKLSMGERAFYSNPNSDVYELDLEDIDASDIFDISKEEEAMKTSTRITLEKGHHPTADSFHRLYRKALNAEKEILANKIPKRKYEAIDKKCENQYIHKSNLVLSEHLVSIRISKQQRYKRNGIAQRMSNQITSTQSESEQIKEKIRRTRVLSPKSTEASVISSREQKDKSTIELTPISPSKKTIRRSVQFEMSEIILNPNYSEHVTVVKQLAAHLKPHQIDGVKFMFNNICPRISSRESEMSQGNDGIKGCILAHNMGLGKSLQTITLLHTFFTNPILQKLDNFNTALICVPVNTLVNWMDEFDKWIGSKVDIPRFQYQSLAKLNPVSQIDAVRRWQRDGGVLIMSIDNFKNMTMDTGIDPNNTHHDPNASEAREILLEPDIVIIDEAHIPLKNEKTKRFKAFESMKTKRRIALTGTPIQNNLMEYYFMTTWVQPNCFESRKYFQTTFLEPIVEGSCSDSTLAAKALQRQATEELHKILDCFVQRRSSELLLNDLPPMQQAVIVVRPSRIQQKLQKLCPLTRFLEWYSLMRPVFNHPGCLLMNGRYSTVDNNERRGSMSPSVIEEDEDEENLDQRIMYSKNVFDSWWKPILRKVSDLKRVEYGAKMLMLLQILAHADKLNEKVVIFSQCLKTLDFIEEVLAHENWTDIVPAMKEITDNEILGNWRRSRDYLRIDGSYSASERGNLVSSFTNNDSLKAFLISTKAGGIGINLTSASRVVLMDCGFNPSIEAQAVYRCYRYGQTKPVFVYRLLAEGTEEKLYKRQVTKIGLSARVIDKENPERIFSQTELDAITNASMWVCCDKCNKWRMLPPETEIDVEKEWYCDMNIHDEPRSRCDAKERDEQWYIKYKRQRDPNWSGEAAIENARAIEMKSKEKQLRKKDSILDELLNHHDGALISRFFFHESLLLEAEIDEEEENAVMKVKSRSAIDSNQAHSIDNSEVTQSEGATTTQTSNVDQIKSVRQGTSRVISTLNDTNHGAINSLSYPCNEVQTTPGNENVREAMPNIWGNMNNLIAPYGVPYFMYPTQDEFPLTAHQIQMRNTVNPCNLTRSILNQWEQTRSRMLSELSFENLTKPRKRKGSIELNGNPSSSSVDSEKIIHTTTLEIPTNSTDIQQQCVSDKDPADKQNEPLNQSKTSHAITGLSENSLQSNGLISDFLSGQSSNVAEAHRCDSGNSTISTTSKVSTRIMKDSNLTKSPNSLSRASRTSGDDLNTVNDLNPSTSLLNNVVVTNSETDIKGNVQTNVENKTESKIDLSSSLSCIFEVEKGNLSYIDVNGAEMKHDTFVPKISQKLSIVEDQRKVPQLQATKLASLLNKKGDENDVIASTSNSLGGISNGELNTYLSKLDKSQRSKIDIHTQQHVPRLNMVAIPTAGSKNRQRSVVPTSCLNASNFPENGNTHNRSVQTDIITVQSENHYPYPSGIDSDLTTTQSNSSSSDYVDEIDSGSLERDCIVTLTLAKLLSSELLQEENISPVSVGLIESHLSSFLLKEYEQLIHDSLVKVDPGYQCIPEIGCSTTNLSQARSPLVITNPTNVSIPSECPISSHLTQGETIHREIYRNKIDIRLASSRNIDSYGESRPEIPNRAIQDLQDAAKMILERKETNKRQRFAEENMCVSLVSEKAIERESSLSSTSISSNPVRKRLLLPSDIISRESSYMKTPRISQECDISHDKNNRLVINEPYHHISSCHYATKRPILPLDALRQPKSPVTISKPSEANTIPVVTSLADLKRRLRTETGHGKRFIRRTGHILKQHDKCDICVFQ